MQDDDVTQWIVRLAQGDEAAAQAIWERYFDKLVRLASKKLGGLPRRTADDHRLARRRFASFLERVLEGPP